MKYSLLVLIFVVCTSLLTQAASAFDRTQIADVADDVSPLLIGQSVPNSTLLTVDGAPVSLKALTLEKPSVIIFYRGGWCPYCNRQLAGLKDIEEQLDALGYQIIAVSPETPAQLQAQKLQEKFTVRLLSDASLDTIKGFGIAFYVDDQTTSKYKTSWDIDLNQQDKSGKAVLPAPAVFILDTKGKVKFSFVNPDFKERLSPEFLLSAAQLLQ
ncbi:MAG: AhpC/TSA family protein [Paraglaciecola sp.]|uniref:peroxiredoxin-like family protein n=1 Tax=Paraglaciecola sp. TaxID=1920173 RepID=UPI00273EBDE7|nr:peroxiredoxin-like family protein [Paraglaciecola sp.]MDP5029651.1 AhpC/TSA family protein [Paraglaciecola sp.]MDP5039310.1 AhpC/TSA family protein [Paraglaciecola sp.]MDP5129946.1 AhpC/TSA family protein [Paraglaciecola sp.]